MERSEIEVGKAKAMTDAWILSEQSELSRKVCRADGAERNRGWQGESHDRCLDT